MTVPDDISRLRVLIVDDQVHVRRWTRSILRQAGITDVTDVGDGREAIAAVTKPGGWYDVILCDLHMPERDGIETIRAFAALALESAIVIMSIEDERVIETVGLLAEVQGLHLLGTVSKPLTPEKLGALLSRLRDVPHTPSLQTEIAPAKDLADAFGEGELLMVYQPKIWTRSGAFAGVEALVRWKHPQLGLFKPAAFLAHIEASDDFSADLVEFTLSSAIASAGRWRKAGRDLPVAVNLSARAFDQLDLPERIEAVCRTADVPTKLVTLEVTETQVERDGVRMIDVATRLRLKGFHLSIDDFGTGQSGLSKLQRLPFDELKIDRQFAHGCASSATQRSVVEASLALARSLKMTSVAEGIQHRRDSELLHELGCDVLQGYMIGRPVTEEALHEWLADWERSLDGTPQVHAPNAVPRSDSRSGPLLMTAMGVA